MEYISGIHALNLPCKLETSGDWHVSSLNWKSFKLFNSRDSIFGDYGIEICKQIPESDELYNVANTLRAILDMMYTDNLLILKGFRYDFIDNENYTKELFDKVLLLKSRPNWDNIDDLMTSEYYMKWINYKRKYNG